MTNPYRAEITAAAAAHALAPDLVDAVTRVESSGKAYAYRYEPAFWAKYLSIDPKWRGANPERVSASYGLMQVLFVVAQELGFTSPDPEHLFVPAIGLEYGCRKLAQLLVWAGGDVARALAAYNGGRVANVRRPLRNQSYADKVLAQMELLKTT